MAINNQFGLNQGFGQIGFQQTGFQSPQPTYKTQNNKYPGVDDEMLKRIEQLADSKGLKGQDRENFIQSAYRQVVNQAVNNTQLQDRDTQINNMCYNAAVSGNKGEEVASRVSTLAQDIKKRYPEYRKANDDDNEVVQWFVGGLMDMGDKNANQKYCDYIEKGDNSFLYDYNLENESLKEETGISGLGLAGIGLGTLGVGAGLLAGPMEWVGNTLYKNSMPKTMKDSRAEIDELANTSKKKIDIKNQEKVVDEAKTALENAKAEGKGVKEAEAALKEAEGTLKDIESRGIKEAETTWKTGLGANVRGSIKQIAARAKVAKDGIWENEIQNVIDNSPQRLNVLEATTKFVEENAYKGHNGKIQAETAQALRNIQKYYGRNTDLQSLSLQEVQNLKSSIMEQLDDAYTAIAKGDRASLTTEEKLLEKYANTLKNMLQEAMQKETDTNVAQAFKKRADLDRIYWEGIKTNAKKEAGKITDNLWTKGTQQLRSRGGWTLSKVGGALKKAKKGVVNTVKKGAKTLWEDVAKNGAKEAKTLLKKGLKKGARGLLDPVAIIMPDTRETLAAQSLDIGTLKRIASGEPNWSDRKLEEMLNKEGATYDTAISEMLDHLKNNDTFEIAGKLREKNRVTTYREAVEDLWNEDPDELIELFESYLESKKGNGGR